MKKTFLIAMLMMLLPTLMWADTHTYYATLKTQVSSQSTGMGKVYAGTSKNAGTYQGSSSQTDPQSSTTSGSSKTFYAFAQANEGFEFVGWSKSDNGTDLGTDSPLTVSLSCNSETSPNSTTYYATFKKLVLAAFGITFETSDAGTYTVDGAAPANKTGLTEATSVQLASSDPNFLNWTVNGTIVNDNPYTATCIADTTIGAAFLTADQVAEVTTYAELAAALADTGKKKITIPSGTSLVVPQGETVTIANGKMLINEGTLFVEGTLNNSGKISGNGTVSTCARLFTQANKEGEWGSSAEPVLAWPSSPKIVYWVTTMASNVGKVSGVSGAVSHITFRNGKGDFIRTKLTGSSVPKVIAYTCDSSIAENHVTKFSATSDNGLAADGKTVLSDLKVLTGAVTYGTAESGGTKYAHSWGSTDCAGNTLTLSKEQGGGAVFRILNGDVSITGKVNQPEFYFINCSSVKAQSFTTTSATKQTFRFFDTSVSIGTSGNAIKASAIIGGDGMAFYSGKYDVDFTKSKISKVYATTDDAGNVYSGAFKNDPSNYLVDPTTYEAKQRASDNYWVVQIKKPTEYVAETDGAQYETLGEAIEKSQSGVITLLKHVELDTPVTIPAGKSVTLELDGYNVTGATGVFVNNGTLVLNDGSHNAQPSMVSATAGNLFVNNGTMEITCGTYEGAVLLNGGNFITHGGTFNVTLSAGPDVTDKSAVADLRGGAFKTDSQIAETTETVDAATFQIGGFLDEGYVAVPYNSALWVGYGTYAIVKDITLSGMEKAWNLTALSASDKALYAKGPATREACADDAEWRRYQELKSMVTPYSGKTVDCVLEFDRDVASGSIAAKVSSYSMNLDTDIAANTKISMLIPRITQSQIDYKRFIYDSDGIFDSISCGLKNNSLDNIGTTCTVYLYLKTATRDTNVGGVWTYTYPDFRPIVQETVKFTGKGAIAGDTDYTSLAAALTAANYTGTVKLSRDCSETITVDRACSFALDNNNFEMTGTIAPAKGFEMTRDGDSYTFSAVRKAGAMAVF